MTNETPAVAVAGLTQVFGERRALDGIDLSVRRGFSLALLGPNGGGKTTLFRILATRLRPTAGRAEIFGHSVIEHPHRVRRRIGVIFQSPAVDRMLTVVENIRHHGHLHGLAGRTLTGRIEEAIGSLGLASRATERVETLSGGLRRRVEIAKVLVQRPDLLLLDEPSTGLDPTARRALIDLLDRLRSSTGATVLLTTHDMEEAERCDLVGILDRGTLVALESPRELKARIGGDVLEVRCTDSAGLQSLGGRVKERFGATPSLVDGKLRIEAPGATRLLDDLVAAFPGEVTAASWREPTLGDVFVHLTGRELREAEA